MKTAHAIPSHSLRHLYPEIRKTLKLTPLELRALEGYLEHLHWHSIRRRAERQAKRPR